VNRFKNTDLKLWHALVLALLLVAITGSAVVIAASSSHFFDAGKIRLASAATDNTLTITGSNNPAVNVLTTSISVPAGKTAELQTTFSADLHHGIGTYAYCFGRFSLDGAVPDNAFRPLGSFQLLGGVTANQPDALTVAMTGYRRNVPAGDHRVSVFIDSAYAGCTLFNRELNVIVNIH
jgi:hypothetical protein